jgi:hypothetical protein
VSSSGMIPRVSGLVALTLCAVVTSGCGAGMKSTSPHPTTSTTTKHYVKLEAGGLSVAPSAGLQDAQQVTVSVRGLPPSQKFYLSECLSPSAVNPIGCGPQLAAQPFGLTDVNGAGSTTFTVHSAASTGALIPTMQPCNGGCVIVATTGVNGAFHSAPISFAPPTIPAATTPACNDGDIAVSDSGGGAAAGHEDQILVFTNEGGSVCTLTGYPGVAGLNAAGQQAVQARRSLGGYMGGLSPDTTTLPVVSLVPGQTASAIVEGTDNSLGSQPCPHYPSLLVTPPNLRKQVRVDVSNLGSQGFPDCSGIEVHPVVAGSGGSSPGF